jgi:hypothetical protein
MMPFWTSDEEDSDYLYAIPSYYMAINKQSAEESEEKKEILLKIYSYLSSVEGQEMLIGDDFQISNIQGVTINENSFSKDIISTIERGQVINTFYLSAGEDNKQVERQMLATVGDMILGNMTVEEWLLAADEVRDKYVTGNSEGEESYGQAETTLTRLETAYTIAKMYAEVTDAPIGICYGGGWDMSTNGYFYEGDITDSSLECITPDKEPASEEDDSNTNKIVSASLTGEQILAILNGTQQFSDTKGFSAYYVAYGLTVEYNPWGDEGERVLSCKLPNGEELDPEEQYEVAYFNGSLPDETIEPDRILDQNWKEAFLSWLDENGGVIKKPEMTLTLVYEQ